MLEHIKCAVFVVATYGDGEPTDNARDFFYWLDTSVNKEHLNLNFLRFTVFGLGNKVYERFNTVAKEVEKNLLAAGGNLVFPSGVFDDDAER